MDKVHVGINDKILIKTLKKRKRGIKEFCSQFLSQIS